MMRYYVQGMWGLGDNIYQRPFIRTLAQRGPVYLETPWPELYEDIRNVFFVRGHRTLRTQLKNVDRQHPGRWVPPPSNAMHLRIHYNLNRLPLFEEMAQAFRIADKLTLDLPPVHTPWPEAAKPIAIVRPVTVRKEWMNAARNPDPRYVSQAAQWLLATHHVVAVADLAAGQETLVGDLPPAHESYLAGEVTISRLLALVAAADVLVGGVGWIVPAAVAAGKRGLIILGGQGGHNAPEKIIAPWWQHQLTFARPERFCTCNNMRHDCPKTILDLPAVFGRCMTPAQAA